MKHTIVTTVLLLAAMAGNGFTGQRPQKITFGPAFGFNITADFHDGSMAANPVPPGGAAIGGGGVPGTVFEYQDGFIGVDSSGNAGGMTWYWGYNDASQVDPANDWLTLSGATGNHTGSTQHERASAQRGFDFAFQQEHGRSRDEVVRWGIQIGAGWSKADVSGNTSRAVDAFPLGGILVPTAPYSGTVNGPGPMIGDTPMSGSSGVHHQLDADVYGLRVGPYLEFWMREKLFLGVGGGLALAHIDSDYSYEQNTVIGGAPVSQTTSSSSGSQGRAGGYAEISFLWHLTDHRGVYTGLRYHNIGKYTHNTDGMRADLDLSRSLFWRFGGFVSF